MQRSLKARLALLWLFMAVVGVTLAVIMVGMYRQGAGFQLNAGQRAAERACGAIQDAFAAHGAELPTSGRPPGEALRVLVDLVLRQRPGVEGGVWERSRGFIAYAYPTYEGGGIKRDVPAAEEGRIAELARLSAAAGSPEVNLRRGSREASVVAACPLPGHAELVAWTLTRVPAHVARVYDWLALGLAVLLVFVVGSGLWLGLVMSRWSRRLVDLEEGLGRHSLDNLPRLAPTGERELDRIIAAVNGFSDRLGAALDESARLGRQLAQADRLAALGRLTVGLAHEIRNPIGAMRLKAENALADPAASRDGALTAILGQVERLDRLLTTMLAMTQPLALRPAEVEIGPWLDECIETVRDAARRREMRISARAAVDKWVFDRLHLGRALENLLWNSIQHGRPDGEVRIEVARAGDALLLRVTDDGAGIAPEVKDRLFEPFATGRVDGTGLGLALAREIAAAHGGNLRNVEVSRGASFELSLPWRAS